MNEHDDQGRPRGLLEERFSDGDLSGTGRYEHGEWTYWYKNGSRKRTAHTPAASSTEHGSGIARAGVRCKPDPSSADYRTDPGRETTPAVNLSIEASAPSESPVRVHRVVDSRSKPSRHP